MLLNRQITGLILLIFLNSFWLISCATVPNQQSSTPTAPKVRNSAELAKKENRGWLGVYTRQVTPEQIKANNLTDSGIAIHNIEQDGPADIGGIKKGDILLKLDGQKLPFDHSLGILSKLIKSAGYGKSVKLEVIRNGRKQILDVILNRTREEEQADLKKQTDIAEQAFNAGRLDEALGIYMKLLEKEETWEGGLGGSALKVILKMKSPPPIPEEANKHFIYGNTALKNAKTPEDAEVALVEYYLALKFAPWVAEYFWNISLAHEQKEEYLEAEKVLQLYTIAATKNLDPQQIKDIEEKRFQLEYKAKGKEEENKKLVVAQEQQKQARQRILQQREQCLKKVQAEADGRMWNIFESNQAFSRWIDSARARCKTTYSVD